MLPRNLVSKYEDGYSVISSVLPKDSKQVADLLLKHANPLVGEMTKENQLVLFGKRPLLVAYFDVDWDKQLRKGMDLVIASFQRSKWSGSSLL